MSSFAENLAALETIEGLAALELRDANGSQVGVIENKPGSAGSCRVYSHLARKYGEIGPNAAREGLEIFAEHTEDARLNPGKHPNIDRLFQVIAENHHLTVHCLSA